MTTPTLTAAEHRVACLYASGLRQRDIAARLNADDGTVWKQLRRACVKLGVDTDDRRAIAQALQTATIGWRRGRTPGVTPEGMRRGDPMRVVGGLFAGRDAVFWARVNHQQVQVKIGGGLFAVRRKNVERVSCETV